MDKYLLPFEKLDVYQTGLDLADRILKFLEVLTQNRHLRLISQMEAAAVLVPQNIAEGKGRQYKKEFIIDRKLNGLINSLQGKERKKNVRMG